MLFIAGFITGVAIVLALHWLANRTYAASVEQQDAVLRWLVDVNEWVYGLDIVQQGLAKRGTVYVLLNRMLTDGLVESRVDSFVHESGVRRRQFRATDVGRAFLRRLSQRRAAVAVKAHAGICDDGGW